MASLPANEPCPLPEDPALADIASALHATGAWGFIVDARWRMVYMTDDIRLSNGGLSERVPVPLNAFWFGPEMIDTMLQWPGGVFGIASWRASLRDLSSMLLEDLGGDEDAVRANVDPRLADAFAPAPGITSPCASYGATAASPGPRSLQSPRSEWPPSDPSRRAEISGTSSA